MGSTWVHRVHDVSPWLLAFGWAMLFLAHYWNRTRHHGGGLPWVLSILWLSTWVMLGNTAILGVEEGLLGHEAKALGLNWPHLLQSGVAGTFLGLLALDVSQAMGLSRIDLARLSGRLATKRPRQARMVGHLINLVIGLALVSAATLIIVNVG